jgi:hypothetical protein
MAAKPKKIALKHLSRIPPTPEELMKVFEAFGGAAPIAAAILGAVLVEHELEMHLRSRFPAISDDDWFELLSEQGALGTFSRKIQLGFAFRIYDKVTCSHLDTIRRIRNAFAHAKRLIDFDHESVIDELKRMSIRNKTMQRRFNAACKMENSGRVLYTWLCTITTLALMRRRSRALKARQRRVRTRSIPRGSFASALMPFLAVGDEVLLPQKGLGFGPLASPPPHIGDPKALTPAQLAREVFGQTPKSVDKKGK